MYVCGMVIEYTVYSSLEMNLFFNNVVVNVDWLNTNGSERKRFYNILETFGFVQNICTETHRSHYLLDYIITRKDCNIISDCPISDFISDHRVLHGSLQCIMEFPLLEACLPVYSKTDSGQSTPSDKG